METKERIFKNVITSLVGIAFMALAVIVGIKVFTGSAINTLPASELFIRIGLIAAIAALGYVFLMAKDSLITGIFLGYFKVKKDETSSAI